MDLNKEFLEFDEWGIPYEGTILGPTPLTKITAQKQVVLLEPNLKVVVRVYIEPETGKLTWKKD